MASRIEVGFKKGMKDALGDSIRKRIIEDLHINVENVRTIEVYTIDADISVEQVNVLGEKLFADPVIQEYSQINRLRRIFPGSWKLVLSPV